MADDLEAVGIKVSGVQVDSLVAILQGITEDSISGRKPDIQFLARRYEEGAVGFDIRFGEGDTWTPIEIFTRDAKVEQVEI